LVVINHGYGFTTKYGHLQKNVVKVGDKVKRGQVIGYRGNTGRSTGTHLHYEIEMNNVPVNPLNYIIDYSLK
ncbi:MAG TPA: M23 family metallopeptidase, partial [Firmicutes bacterium]|nr:M23 family metallopeptidase [Bacillota bacterium]